MKKFKLVSEIMLIIAAVAFAAGIIASAASASADEAAYLVLIQANAVILSFAAGGIFLMHCKNDIAKKVGHGLTIAAFVAGLTCAVTVIAALSKEEYIYIEGMERYSASVSIGAVIMIVAAAFLVAHYAFLLVAYMLGKNSANYNPNEDIRIIRVKEWKSLMEEGIITEEEYEEKRLAILGIKSKSGKTE